MKAAHIEPVFTVGLSRLPPVFAGRYSARSALCLARRIILCAIAIGFVRGSNYNTTAFASRRDIGQDLTDMTLLQINQSVGGFLSKIVSSHVCLTIIFHMIGNKSFHFIF